MLDRTARSGPRRALFLLAVLAVAIAACGGRSGLLADGIEGGDGGAGGAPTSPTTGGTGGAGGELPMPLCGFSVSFGDLFQQFVTDMAVDGQGNTIVVGRFLGEVDFGDQILDSMSAEDPLLLSGEVFVVKIDPSGQTLWSRSYGVPEDSVSTHVAVNAQGDIFLATYGSAPIDLGTGELQPGATVDAFLARIDPQGETMWSRNLLPGTTASAVTIDALRVDPVGNVVVLGVVDDAHRSFLLAKIEPQGNEVFTRLFIEDTGFMVLDSSNALAIDGQGGIAITLGVSGFADTSVDFGGGPIDVEDQAAVAIVARFDASGELLYARALDLDAGIDDHTLFAPCIVAGIDGDLFVSTGFDGTVDVGTGQHMAAPGGSMVVARLDLQGNAVWSRAFGDGASAHAMAISADGSLVLGGSIEGSIDLGGGPLANDDDDDDLFVAALDQADGSHRMSRRFGPGLASIERIAVDGSGAILLSGQLLGDLRFCEGFLTSAGQSDVFAAKILP